ncbi:hypothetical protein D3C75_1088170 [compost metagenome]
MQQTTAQVTDSPHQQQQRQRDKHRLYQRHRQQAPLGMVVNIRDQRIEQGNEMYHLRGCLRRLPG